MISVRPLLVGEAILENAKAPVLLWVLDFASLRIQDVAKIVFHVIFAYLPRPKDHMKYFTYVIQFSPHPSLWGRCPHVPTYKRGAWESRGFATCLICWKQSQDLNWGPSVSTLEHFHSGTCPFPFHTACCHRYPLVSGTASIAFPGCWLGSPWKQIWRQLFGRLMRNSHKDLIHWCKVRDRHHLWWWVRWAASPVRKSSILLLACAVLSSSAL